MNTIKILLGAILISSLCACSALKEIQLDDVVGAIDNVTGENGLSNTDVISGLREALKVGTNQSVSKVNIADGFLKNNLIKIPLPKEAEKVATISKRQNL